MEQSWKRKKREENECTLLPCGLHATGWEVEIRVLKGGGSRVANFGWSRHWYIYIYIPPQPQDATAFVVD